ncbi:MAG: alpha-2-macroglobulin family protein, partial [Perlucidibaca sp.]
RKTDIPVAYWSGIVDADDTERTLEYVVPDHFNGKLRVIAVAVSDGAIGVYEGATLVRGDFILSPNAPTFVAPGDTFDVSLGVSNQAEGSGADAKLALKLVTGKDGLGGGDSKLLAALGAWLGGLMLPSVILLASLIGLGIALWFRWMRGQHGAFPFGPALAASAALLFCQQALLG